MTGSLLVKALSPETVLATLSTILELCCMKSVTPAVGLAAGLSVYDGVALLATATKVKDKFILDTGSFYNLGPHLPPDGLPDTPGAASELRASLSIRHTQTAGGGTLSLGATFDSQGLVRT